MKTQRSIWNTVAFIVFGVGVFLCLGAFNDEILLQHCKQPPEQITAAKLAEAKTADNWYVQITDYSIDKPLIVKSASGSEPKYLECYLVPAGASKSKIRVQNMLIHNEADAETFLKQHAIVAFLRPPMDFETDHLLDFENLVRVKVDNYPTDSRCNDMARAGIGLIVFGLVWLAILRWR